jgi:hypothetical protein
LWLRLGVIVGFEVIVGSEPDHAKFHCQSSPKAGTGEEGLE